MSEVPKKSLDDRRVPAGQVKLLGYVNERMMQIPEDVQIPTEVVEYQGKIYRMLGIAEDKSFSFYKTTFEQADQRGEELFVVDDFTSDHHPKPVPAVFVEASKDLAETVQAAGDKEYAALFGIFQTYADAIAAVLEGPKQKFNMKKDLKDIIPREKLNKGGLPIPKLDLNNSLFSKEILDRKINQVPLKKGGDAGS